MCGRDEFGVTGRRGVNGLAAGFSVNFFGAALSDVALSLPDDAFGVCYTDHQTQNVIAAGSFASM